MIRRLQIALLLGAAFASTAVTADAPDYRSLSAAEEFALALSAAPEHLRAEAGVYVLAPKGFEQHRESRNGFNCLVIRTADVIAPTCFDAEGSRTTLHANLRREALRADGLADAAIEEAIAADYASGKLKAPARPGVAYMLSREFVRIDSDTGVTRAVFPPHLMFYAPYLTDEDIGALPEHRFSHVHPWVLQPGSPSAYIIVVPPQYQH